MQFVNKVPHVVGFLAFVCFVWSGSKPYGGQVLKLPRRFSHKPHYIWSYSALLLEILQYASFLLDE